MVSENGEVVVYRASNSKSKEEILVVGGSKTILPSGGISLRLSRDGKIVTYRTQQGTYMAMVVNGRTGPEFWEIQDPIFSPDGSRAAYLGKRKAGWTLMVGEREIGTYDRVFASQFSRDGKQITCVGLIGREFRRVTTKLE